MKVYVVVRDISRTGTTGATDRNVLGVFLTAELARAHILECSKHLRDEETPVQPGSYADHGDYIGAVVNGWWHEYFYRPYVVDKPEDAE